MPSNIMRKKIDQPVNAASKEQSDLGVARGVYEQLRQGVEPKLLLEQVDDAICATSGKQQIPDGQLYNISLELH